MMGSHLSLETGYCAYGSCRDLLHAHFHHGFDWQTGKVINDLRYSFYDMQDFNFFFKKSENGFEIKILQGAL